MYLTLKLVALLLAMGSILASGQAVSGQESNALADQAHDTGSVEKSASSDKAIIIDNAVLKIVEERNVPARTKGIIQKSNVREGSLVQANELLMTIDSAQPQIELRKTQKELEMATLEAESRVDLIYVERSIEVAQAELERAKRSNQRRPGVVAQSELDQLDLIVSRSIAEKEKTEFQIEMRSMLKQVRDIELELKQQQIELCQIVSPMVGMIVDIFKREGEWVEASEPVARMVRLDLLRAEIKVPADFALKEILGAQATFIPKLESSTLQRAYPGKIVFVYPEANPISADVRVWVEIQNHDLKLIPGLLGRIEVEQIDLNPKNKPDGTAPLPSSSDKLSH